MRKINGLIIDGKVYKAIPQYTIDSEMCDNCILTETCESIGEPLCTIVWQNGNYLNLQFSPELTNKLQGKVCHGTLKNKAIQ